MKFLQRARMLFPRLEQLEVPARRATRTVRVCAGAGALAGVGTPILVLEQAHGRSLIQTLDNRRLYGWVDNGELSEIPLM